MNNGTRENPKSTPPSPHIPFPKGLLTGAHGRSGAGGGGKIRVGLAATKRERFGGAREIRRPGSFWASVVRAMKTPMPNPAITSER